MNEHIQHTAELISAEITALSDLLSKLQRFGGGPPPGNGAPAAAPAPVKRRNLKPAAAPERPRGDLGQAIVRQLTKGPASPRGLAEALGSNRESVAYQLKRLKGEGRIQSAGRTANAVYSLASQNSADYEAKKREMGIAVPRDTEE